MIIKDLRGIESTQDACAKIRVGIMKMIHKYKTFWFKKRWTYLRHFILLFLPQKSKDSRKGPVVILSITYRGVKFIDAATKVVCTSVSVCVGEEWDFGGVAINLSHIKFAYDVLTPHCEAF